MVSNLLREGLRVMIRGDKKKTRRRVAAGRNWNAMLSLRRLLLGGPYYGEVCLGSAGHGLLVLILGREVIRAAGDRSTGIPG
jgi:hypothetical protein